MWVWFGADGQEEELTSVPMCDSCGSEGDPLRPVRRQYLTPESWDTEASARPADDTEQWCEVCRLHYPHEMLD